MSGLASYPVPRLIAHLLKSRIEPDAKLNYQMQRSSEFFARPIVLAGVPINESHCQLEGAAGDIQNDVH